MLVAAAALIWAIWLTRNEVIFEKARSKTFLQVLFRGTHWLRMSTSTCYYRRVDTLKFLLWSSSVLGAGYLVDGLAQFDRVLHFLVCQYAYKP